MAKAHGFGDYHDHHHLNTTMRWPEWIAPARRQGHQCVYTLRISLDFDESHLIQRHRTVAVQGANEKCVSGEKKRRVNVAESCRWYVRDCWIFNVKWDSPTPALKLIIHYHFSLNQSVSALETNEDETPKGGFNGDFHMEFCDNKQQLFQAYFREFQIEEMSNPWKAFTDGWHAEITAKKLGINSSYITGDYRWVCVGLEQCRRVIELNWLIILFLYLSTTCSYVLVRVSRFREKAKLLKPIRPNQLIEPDVLEKMRNVTVGDTTSALQFMQKYGTHYINSYTTGNSLYQVSCCCDVFNWDKSDNRPSVFFVYCFSTAQSGFRLQQTQLFAYKGETEVAWSAFIVAQWFVQFLCALVRWTSGHGALLQWQFNGRTMGDTKAQVELLSLHLQQLAENPRIGNAAEVGRWASAQWGNPAAWVEVTWGGI